MFLDWLLASFHHLAVFSLAAILSAEIFLTLGPIDDRMALRLARVDAWFGIMAALALAAGLMRLAFGAKGADYYLAQHLLLAQDGAVRRRRGDLDRADFSYLVWRRRVRADASFRPPAREIARLRRALYAEAGLFALIPLCAAAMARGYGT
jgi:putative membrane protein